MKRLLFFATALFSFIPSFAQKGYVSDDYDFIDYLFGNDLIADAALYLSEKDFHPSDTLDFLKGWSDYGLHRLDEASASFSAVPASSAFFDKSTFFNAVCNAHQGRYEVARQILQGWSSRLENSAQPLKDAYCLEMAGLSILENKPEAYQEWSGNYTGETAFLKANFNELDQIYADAFEKPSRKPWIAAVSSAILPGSGYYYAGEKERGVLAFLLEAAFAAVIWDQYHHYGLKDWHTLLWAGAGLTVHIINIYGATVSVGIRNEDFIQNRNTAVLYNIHIPLRTIFR